MVVHVHKYIAKITRAKTRLGNPGHVLSGSSRFDSFYKISVSDPAADST